MTDSAKLIEVLGNVKDAIDALKKANLSYAFSDMNGGAAPDDR